VKSKLQFVFVDTAQEVLKMALDLDVAALHEIQPHAAPAAASNPAQ
jgi:hypothetical protein